MPLESKLQDLLGWQVSRKLWEELNDPYPLEQQLIVEPFDAECLWHRYRPLLLRANGIQNLIVRGCSEVDGPRTDRLS